MKKTIEISYEEKVLSELAQADQELVRIARRVRNDAYAPYSKFFVGAAALLSNGEVVTGSNQENVAYPSGLCAERVTLFYAGANFPNEKVEVLCIVASGELLEEGQHLSPCGGCRQVMVETESRQNENYRVILVDENDRATCFSSAKDLLPLSFGSAS